MTLRFSLFMVDSVMSAVPAFIVLWAVSQVADADTYGTVAIGQAFGVIGAIAVIWGWELSGPPKIARADPQARKEYYAESIGARLWLFLPAVSLGMIGLWFATDGSYLAIVPGLAGTLSGLSPSWFYIGTGDSRSLVLLETIPNVAATLLGAFLTVYSGYVLPILVLPLLGALISPIVASVQILGTRRLCASDFRFANAVAALRKDAAPAATGATTALYVTLPVLLVAAVNHGAVASFAAAERLQRSALSLATPVTKVLQGWVPSTDQRIVVSRIFRALAIGAATSATLATITAFTAAPILRLTTGGEISISVSSSLFLGLIVGAIALSQVTGIVCLASLGIFSKVLTSTILGAIVGLGLVPVIGHSHGTVGALGALALAELTVLLYQLWAVLAALRELRKAPQPELVSVEG
ncbi:hypothetical protein [Streptomyces sp. MP131-18]|uniref:hypothetical protein n=1 Tax=Streptomyces sp. MP131-18 TaxID=1857892 RepID=UPI0009CE3849|nr:hypothetical protein [Streptomyces sp. MP131-18]ONK10476.1 hypothetical protein STBA_11980 [Streptomyces sp. MP131-18]